MDVWIPLTFFYLEMSQLLRYYLSYVFFGITIKYAKLNISYGSIIS
jgi:hypothetical protein